MRLMIFSRFLSGSHCEIEIPFPDLESQRSLVNIYKAYILRRAINERLKAQIKDLCPILIKGSIEEASA